MHQTTKYALNLIDPADEFSPDPLNENFTSLDAELGKRLVFAHSSYSGSGKYGSANKNRLQFSFKPIMLVIVATNGGYSAGNWVWLRNANTGQVAEYQSVNLTWLDNAVEWYNNESDVEQLNASNIRYSYLALGTNS